jgi:hypothetical protein
MKNSVRQESRTANIVLAIGGLNGFVSTEVQNSTSVLRLKFSAKTPAHRQYAARCAACYEATVPKLTTTKTTNVKILQAHASQKQKSCKANTQKPTRICSTFVLPRHIATL